MFNAKLIDFDINKSKIVVLTGAGISAESGLKTFRDNNGLWENHRVEEVATPEAFAVNPDLVYRFYNLRRQQLLDTQLQPNSAHFALAELESVMGERLQVVTQNVDNLHERAGSQHVIHMHGELCSAKCVKSQKAIPIYTDIDKDSRCECCKPAQMMRPDIVWFGEVPYHMQTIEELLYDADIFVSIGTSGNVYPAAGFVQLASSFGAQCIELNLEPSEGSTLFDHAFHAPASELVPRFVEFIIAK